MVLDNANNQRRYDVTFWCLGARRVDICKLEFLMAPLIEFLENIAGFTRFYSSAQPITEKKAAQP